MEDRILLVDDDPNLLAGIKRQLKGKFDITTVQSGADAITEAEKKSFSVIISDYKMPAMNGAQVLSKVRHISPGTVRMMLTGQADIEAVIDIVNEGNIFRFLTKPCPPEVLINNINAALNQYHLQIAEKELLSKTLSGSLQVLTDILVLAKPLAFNRGLRIREIIKRYLLANPIENAWQIEIAAMLSQIGCVTIPDSILEKVYSNTMLQVEDKIIFQLHTKTSSEIISKIPRLETVSEIIAYQEKYYNGTGFPGNDVKTEAIPLGARILRIALDYDQLLQSDKTPGQAMNELKNKIGWYDPEILNQFEKAFNAPEVRKKYTVKRITVNDLNENMYLNEELISASGVILGKLKQRITKTLIITLKNYVSNKEITDHVSVIIPIDE